MADDPDAVSAIITQTAGTQVFGVLDLPYRASDRRGQP
jgi:hypothetical protein